MAEGTLILNAARDIKNSVSGEELEEITRSTLSQIGDALLSISGPYAKNDFILGNAFEKSNMSNAISVGNVHLKAFTKDGRRILGQMDYASPIQKYIKNDVVSHIGKCIDDKCGDGTTTAMIFVTSFVANLMKYKEYFGRVSTNKLEEIYKDATDGILKELEKFIITTEDENVTPGNMAYLQAFTSSGGMKNVATAIKMVIDSTPKELWEYAMTQEYPKGESEAAELISIVKENYQYGIPVTLYNPGCLFRTIENTYECDDASVLIAPYGFVTNDVLFDKIKKYIETEQDKPLMIIIPGVFKNNIDEIVAVAERHNKEVLVFGHTLPVAYSCRHDWTLNALNIKANVILPAPDLVENIDVKKDLLINAKVFTNGKYLKIGNFLPEDLDSNLHPVFKDPENYKNTLSMIPVLNKMLQSELAMPEKNAFVINDLKRALSIITSVYNVVIRVNGTAMDQQLISLILDDASTATQNSLIHGMVFDGPFRLYQATFTAGINYLKNKSVESMSTLCTILMYKCLLQASVDMTQAVYGEYSKKMQCTIPEFLDKYNLNDKMSFYAVSREFSANTSKSTFNIGEALSINNSFNFEEYDPKYELDSTIVVNNNNIFKVMESMEINEMSHDYFPPCQPANFFKELLNRVRECGLRFAMIGSLVVPGTVWDSNLKNKGE